METTGHPLTTRAASLAMRPMIHLLWALAACTAMPDPGLPDPADPPGDPDTPDPTDPGGPTDPTDPTSPGTIDVGPLVDLVLYNPCGRDLWGRWTSGEDFDLTGVEIWTEDGDEVARVTYFDAVGFVGGTLETYRFFDQDARFGDPAYDVQFLFAGAPSARAVIESRDALPPATGRFVLDDVRDAFGSDIELRIRPSGFDGGLFGFRWYDPADGCFDGDVVFFDLIEPDSDGVVTVRLGPPGSPGSEWDLVLQGVDRDAGVVVYDQLRLTLP
ncbi:MAG: hypothetical protein AAF602_13070 [Myxococcota bacterium]